jgi:hypothetical protein
MVYKVRLNEDPEFEAEVNHYEKNDDDHLTVIDASNFDFPQRSITVEKIELIGEDGEVCAMRKFPPQLTITFTPKMQMAIQFKLVIVRDLIA